VVGDGARPASDQRAPRVIHLVMARAGLLALAALTLSARSQTLPDEAWG